MTEDADYSDLENEILTGSRRLGSCSVCDWLQTRPEAEQEIWDRNMARPVKLAGHHAIHKAMTKRGFDLGKKSVEDHRRKGHRARD